MRKSVAIVYNKPEPCRYDNNQEKKAVEGVLQSVAAVHQALIELGYNVVTVPLLPPLKKTEKKLASLNVEAVFNLFEGFCGQPDTEALIPEIMSRLGLHYTGCTASVLRLGLNKDRVKVLLKRKGIPTPDFQLLDPYTLHTFHLAFPCIVKPVGEDASHGITAESVVHDLASLEKQVRRVNDSCGDNALVEEFLSGREFNATVMGNMACTVLPVSEIVYTLPAGVPQILSYEAKWEEDSAAYRGTNAVCPADISQEEQQHIQDTAQRVYNLLGCSGYARVDMRMDGKGQVNVIEVNPNPDISPGAGAARQAKAAGMNYTAFIEKIVRLALEREDHDSNNPPDGEERQTGSDEAVAGYTRI